MGRSRTGGSSPRIETLLGVMSNGKGSNQVPIQPAPPRLCESQSVKASATDERRCERIVSYGVTPARNNPVLKTGLRDRRESPRCEHFSPVRSAHLSDLIRVNLNASLSSSGCLFGRRGDLSPLCYGSPSSAVARLSFFILHSAFFTPFPRVPVPP